MCTRTRARTRTLQLAPSLTCQTIPSPLLSCPPISSLPGTSPSPAHSAPPDPSFALPQMTNVTVRQTAIRAIQHNVSLDQHARGTKANITASTVHYSHSHPASVCDCVSAALVCVRAHGYYSCWPGSLDLQSHFQPPSAKAIDNVLDGELHHSKGLITPPFSPGCP